MGDQIPEENVAKAAFIGENTPENEYGEPAMSSP